MAHEGECPRCGSENLRYDELELGDGYDDTLFYPFTCKDCGISGREWHRLQHIQSTIDGQE